MIIFFCAFFEENLLEVRKKKSSKFFKTIDQSKITHLESTQKLKINSRKKKKSDILE